jgi:superfamily II DNA or RNA helicase/HKD family nuclease
MEIDLLWEDRFSRDIQYGYVGGQSEVTGEHNPRIVMNGSGSTVEHAIIEELNRCHSFTFSVAFISAAAIAQLKQHLHDFTGTGRIITSDYLTFNQPQAFAELLNLREISGIEVRRHSAEGFHPKGYIFEQHKSVTAMIGSSNLTSHALSQNYELNLRVSAAKGSDLANQIDSLVADQINSSVPLTHEWIDDYALKYIERISPVENRTKAVERHPYSGKIEPNSMQQDALLALDFARAENQKRAIIISATGTGKTMLSALDIRSFDPKRLLFIVHREQILDRTIQEYQRVLDNPLTDYGKFTGSHKGHDTRFVFATIQTLAQETNLLSFSPQSFDYIIIDEAHRAGADSYQRVISHFAPKFLLGMTATPERMDGFNVFELFHYNVPYEIRLNDALEAGMLCPFHYYGIADITYADGSTTTDATQLRLLVSQERVRHLVKAIEIYGQAGDPPRGLIFCSRKDEAQELSRELNKQKLRGKYLRTIALTGEDSINLREQRVAELEAGLLDYILTVDVFNEGVDIPSLNQIIMLRQTQSAVVFVQQLGRGLRLHDGKEYLVVIDFIGNYVNNFMIPIALFGDATLNREALRERLNETVESGTIPGLSSVSFDEVSRDRILKSISTTKFDSLSNLKIVLAAMQHRVGEIPRLWNFYRFKSVDPLLLATKREHYPALVQALLQVKSNLTEPESQALELLSHEVFGAKRLHEYVLFQLLRSSGSVTEVQIAEAFKTQGLLTDQISIKSAIDTLTLEGYPKSDVAKYGVGIAEQIGSVVQFTKAFVTSYSNSSEFEIAINDIIKTGTALTSERYQNDLLFTPGMQYSRRDAAHIIGWPRSTHSTIYGYKTDGQLGVCAVFVTLKKSDEVEASTAYQDELLDTWTMRWFSRNRRTLQSTEVSLVVSGAVKVHVFVKKDDAEGTDHYYLGSASAQQALETTMPNSAGAPLQVVQLILKFDKPVKQGLFDYFHDPELT